MTNTIRHPVTLWEFEDSAGVIRRGYVEKISDFGGSDIVYRMRTTDGQIKILSGVRLKNAKVVPSDG